MVKLSNLINLGDYSEQNNYLIAVSLLILYDSFWVLELFLIFPSNNYFYNPNLIDQYLL